MEYKFYIQDPTSADTVYLYEAIISAAEDAVTWNGIFAFATKGGVDMLISDPVVKQFLENGSLSLLVGIDAVTNRATLERLQELEGEFERFEAKVFWNQTGGLFHPKISYFQYADGQQVVIVGSGNLTPGGLQNNFEAYSVLQASADENLNLSSWDEFIHTHSNDIRQIDEQSLDRAARNIVRAGRRRPVSESADIEQESSGATEDEMQNINEDSPHNEGIGRILIAQVPRAGGRWGQIHYNQAIINQYFRVRPNSLQRVYLVHCHFDGSKSDQESRPCVFSQRNKNLKIELSAARGKDYPQDGVPIVVFKELQARAFEYMLLCPRDTGYAETLQLTTSLPSVGRGLRRVITDIQVLRNVWPDCPLLI